MSDTTTGETMATTKERPIIFTGESVKAILDGRKTQTRRVMKPQPDSDHDGRPYWCIGGYRAWQFTGEQDPLRIGTHNPIVCPYGRVGDRLWVKETYSSPLKTMGLAAYHADAECGAWIGDGGGGKLWIRHGLVHESPNYMNGHFPSDTKTLRDYGGKWKSGRFMPRWASRLTLEITGVRCERLHDITPVDAKAEGMECPPGCVPDNYWGGHLIAYKRTWDKINGKSHPWESNPWVWVIEFKRVSGEGRG